VEQIRDDVWVHRVAAAGFETTSAVVFARARVFVVDTLLAPRDMEPVRQLLGDRPGRRRLVVVNTHHHWDHVYGNAAFAKEDIVAQQTCPRLMLLQSRGADGETVPVEPAEGIELPNITFGDRLTFADDVETVHLLHAPGHSEDSLVVFLERARVLLGGDALEWPLPSFSQRDGRTQWVRTLRQLKQLPVDMVVPSHGPVRPKSIIDANECYIEGVYESVAAAKRSGVPRTALDVPAGQFLDSGVELDAFYRDAHRQNLEWAWDET
jgi:cyclase